MSDRACFIAVATVGQWALHGAGLLSQMMGYVGPLLGGAILVVAGLYQWSPLKHAGRLAVGRAARMIRQGVGHRGSSRAYLENTVRHLGELGIRDGSLHALLAAVEALDGGGGER